MPSDTSSMDSTRVSRSWHSNVKLLTLECQQLDIGVSRRWHWSLKTLRLESQEMKNGMFENQSFTITEKWLRNIALKIGHIYFFRSIITFLQQYSTSKKVLILQENSYQYSTPSTRQTRAAKHTMRIRRFQEKNIDWVNNAKVQRRIWTLARNVEFWEVA